MVQLVGAGSLLAQLNKLGLHKSHWPFCTEDTISFAVYVHKVQAALSSSHGTVELGTFHISKVG